MRDREKDSTVEILLDISKKNSENIWDIKQSVTKIGTRIEYMPDRAELHNGLRKVKEETLEALKKHSKSPIAHGGLQLSKKQMIAIITLITALLGSVSTFGSYIIETFSN